MPLRCDTYKAAHTSGTRINHQHRCLAFNLQELQEGMSSDYLLKPQSSGVEAVNWNYQLGIIRLQLRSQCLGGKLKVHCWSSFRIRIFSVVICRPMPLSAIKSESWLFQNQIHVVISKIAICFPWAFFVFFFHKAWMPKNTSRHLLNETSNLVPKNCPKVGCFSQARVEAPVRWFVNFCI